MKTVDTEFCLINPPALLDKPPIEQSGTLFIPERLKIAAINPGILSIASYLDSKGYAVRILDLSGETDWTRVGKLLSKAGAGLYGISSTSAFDYIESLEIARLLKSYFPETPVILGGQHAGALGSGVLRDSPHVDAVVLHEGEWVAEQMLCSQRKGLFPFSVPGVVFRRNGRVRSAAGEGRRISVNELPFLKYELYPDFRKFMPYVEESRGCCYRCHYCSSNSINQSRIDPKDPGRFLEEFSECVKLFGRDRAYAVLASSFGVLPKNGKAIARGMRRFGIKWNSEFRVDGCWEEYIGDLLSAGYEVVNVGLESASPSILRLMNKTRQPEQYLEKMARLAGIVSGSDSVIRANLMFYAGESPQTLRETLSFLSSTKGIDSIQYSPLLLFPGAPVTKEFGTYEKRFGAKMVDHPYWRRRHLYPIHPSNYFSFEESVYFCHVTEKIFSDEDAWLEAAKGLYTQESDQEIAKTRETLRVARFRRSGAV
ncbi:MAG: cobalamin-dependent protein [Elusimicrobia bacterium]|nr:cobalamin-dependent protein [Elusimicrobiota bacterium]